MKFLAQLGRFWLWVFLGTSAIYFAANNRTRIGLSLPPWIEHINIPAYVAFLAFFLAGAIVVSFYFGLDSIRKAIEIRRLKKQLRDLTGDDRVDPSVQNEPQGDR